MLFFELFDQRLQELLLGLHLLHLRVHLNRNDLTHSSLMHLITADLSEQFESAHRALQQATLVEVLAELSTAFLFLDLLRVLLPGSE